MKTKKIIGCALLLLVATFIFWAVAKNGFPRGVAEPTGYRDAGLTYEEQKTGEKKYTLKLEPVGNSPVPFLCVEFVTDAIGSVPEDVALIPEDGTDVSISFFTTSDGVAACVHDVAPQPFKAFHWVDEPVNNFEYHFYPGVKNPTLPEWLPMDVQRELSSR